MAAIPGFWGFVHRWIVDSSGEMGPIFQHGVEEARVHADAGSDYSQKASLEFHKVFVKSRQDLSSFGKVVGRKDWVTISMRISGTQRMPIW